tara:strand:+ start:341 stop:1204 length:864 start_codon:yes stop_codon:yes gene_type:complete
MSKIIFNGELLNEENLMFNQFKRAVNFGDGFFETIRVINGKEMFFEDHFTRLITGLNFLKIDYPISFNFNFLKKQIHSLLEINNINSGGKIKMYFFRSGLGTYKPVTNKISYLIETNKLNSNLYELNKKGYLVSIFNKYKKQINSLSSFKTSNSLLYVLASLFAEENNLNDSLILNENNYIIESSNSNIFLLHNQSIITPPLSSGCINGIMRKVIFSLLKELNIEIIERNITENDLEISNEIFLSNVINGVSWISGYNQIRYYNSLSKKLIKKLNQDLVINRIKREI